MNIIILTTSYPLFDGDSTGNFVSGLAEELVSRKLKVDVVAPHTLRSATIEDMGGVRIRRFRYAPKSLEKVAYGFGVLGNIRHSVLAKIELPFFMVSFFVIGLRVAKKADIIHANWTFAALIAIAIKKFTKKPIVLTVHGSDIEKVPNFLNKFILKRVNHTIAVSSHLAKKCLDLSQGKGEITVIPNGITALESFLSIGPKLVNNYKVLAIGRLSDEKNFLYLIEEFLLVLDKIPQATLSIIGEGAERNNLQKLITKKGISKNVQLLGHKNRSEIIRLLTECDIFAMPSKREGFGLALAEAMAAGRATVVANSGGLLDIANKSNSVVCRLEDKHSFSKAIIGLLKNKEKRLIIAEKARIFARDNYSFEKVATKTLTVYKSLTK